MASNEIRSEIGNFGNTKAGQGVPAGNLPEKKFRAGAISATVWKNMGEKDGKPVEFRSISMDRVYKDKNDTWQHTSTMRLNDLPRAVVVLQQTYEYLVLKGEEA